MAHDAGKQDPPSLDEFSKRLDAARGDPAVAKATPAGSGQGMGKAFRLSSELLAALIVGTLLGWGVDRLFGTLPWGLLIGVFVGFAAGLRNVAAAMKQQSDAAPKDGG